MHDKGESRRTFIKQCAGGALLLNRAPTSGQPVGGRNGELQQKLGSFQERTMDPWTAPDKVHERWRSYRWPR